MSTAARSRDLSLKRDSRAAPPDGGKRAAQVARAIEDEARRRGWPTGELLGSEADLMTRYGVSRAVLREAVRLVEHHQVATMRRGPNGGLILRAPDVGPAAEAVVVYLEYVGTTLEDLFQARLILEPLASSLAAGSITEDGIHRLRGAIALESELDDLALARTNADKIHLLLAELSGNPALRLFIEVLTMLTTRYADRPRRTKRSVHEAAEAVSVAHNAIAEAVIAGNAAVAEQRTSRHLVAMVDWIRSQPSRSLSERRRDEEFVEGKLAEVVARNIRMDIVDSGWNVGSVVGSESELLERYRVSRSVLREAARILEHHSVARMRRGPGGGLVVTEPQPAASVEAMALYLDRQDITVTALRTARGVIELGCIDLVAGKAGDPQVAEKLHAAMTLSTETPEREMSDLSNQLHNRICELSGNPVLALFSRIMTTLWSRHTAVPRPDSPNHALTGPVMDAHAAIVDALLAQDAALARHRMSRHLDATTDWWH